MSDRVKIYNHYTEEFYDLTPYIPEIEGGEPLTENSKMYTCNIVLPPNSSEDEIIHTLELYIKRQITDEDFIPSGKRINIRVLGYTPSEIINNKWINLPSPYNSSDSQNVSRPRLMWSMNNKIYVMDRVIMNTSGVIQNVVVNTDNYPIIRIFDIIKQSWSSLHFGLGIPNTDNEIALQSGQLLGKKFIPTGFLVIDDEDVLITYTQDRGGIVGTNEIRMLRYNVGMNRYIEQSQPKPLQPNRSAATQYSVFPNNMYPYHWIFKDSNDSIHVLALGRYGDESSSSPHTSGVQAMFCWYATPNTDKTNYNTFTAPWDNTKAPTMNPKSYSSFNMIQCGNYIYPITIDPNIVYAVRYNMITKKLEQLSNPTATYTGINALGEETLLSLTEYGYPILMTDDYIYYLNGNRHNIPNTESAHNTEFIRVNRNSGFLLELDNCNHGTSDTSGHQVSNYVIIDNRIFKLNTGIPTCIDSKSGQLELYVINDEEAATLDVQAFFVDRKVLYKDGGYIGITIAIKS